jgi:hypothetical protein
VAAASTSPTTPAAKRTPFPLKTTVDATPAAVRALFTKFQLDKAASGKPVAVVSGGSVSGYATALALAKKGFSVLVVEKRDGYRTPGHSPRTVWRSEWQTPQYRMSIATSFARGSRRLISNGARDMEADWAA